MSRQEAVSEISRRVEGDGGDVLGRLRRVARLALPLDAAVTVVTEGDDDYLDLHVPLAVSFPQTSIAAPGHPPTDEALITELERLRAANIHFLVVPAPGPAWLGEETEFHRHVTGHCRLVFDEEGTGTVYSLQEPEDRPPDGIGPDRLPLPTPEMIHLVAGMFEWKSIYGPFLSGGEVAADCIKGVLEKNDLDINDFESVFDFGCGCGRVMRHWQSLMGPRLHGSDYNPYLVEWCRSNLTFADFTVNGFAPPLDYADEQFDFVYALSVFTHFVEVLQIPWAQEIARVIRPGGYALLTLHGDTRAAPDLNEEQRKRFDAGEMVVLVEERAGTNATAAFHSERYLREHFTPQAGFEVVDWVPEAQRDAKQDSVLLRRT